MSSIYTLTERTAHLEAGDARLRGSVATDGDEDRVTLRIWTRAAAPAYCLSLRLSDLRAYLAELERLARENRGEAA